MREIFKNQTIDKLDVESKYILFEKGLVKSLFTHTKSQELVMFDEKRVVLYHGNSGVFLQRIVLNLENGEIEDRESPFDDEISNFTIHSSLAEFDKPCEVFDDWLSSIDYIDSSSKYSLSDVDRLENSLDQVYPSWLKNRFWYMLVEHLEMHVSV